MKKSWLNFINNVEIKWTIHFLFSLNINHRKIFKKNLEYTEHNQQNSLMYQNKIFHIQPIKYQINDKTLTKMRADYWGGKIKRINNI